MIDHRLWERQQIGRVCGCGDCECCRSLSQPRARSLYDADAHDRRRDWSRAAASLNTYMQHTLNNR